MKFFTICGCGFRYQCGSESAVLAAMNLHLMNAEARGDDMHAHAGASSREAGGMTAQQCKKEISGPKVARNVVAWRKRCGNKTTHASGYCHLHQDLGERLLEQMKRIEAENDASHFWVSEDDIVECADCGVKWSKGRLARCTVIRMPG